MKKIIFITALGLCLFSAKTYSQTVEQDTLSFNYEVSPSDPVEELGVAYTKLEAELLADIDWLNYTPVDKDHEIRNEKSRFVLMWISGSPTVSVQMDSRVVSFEKSKPAIVLAYMMGWVKYSIEHGYSTDPVECTVAGIANAVTFYDRNRKSFKKDKELEKYKTMIEDRTLVRYIADILTKE